MILCSTGALTLSLGFMTNKDINKIKAASQSKIIPNVPFVPFVHKGNVTTVVTVEEQNMVENSTALFGFVQQENGPGFFFEKENAYSPLNTDFKDDNYQRSSGVGKESSGPGFIPNFKGPIYLKPLE